MHCCPSKELKLNENKFLSKNIETRLIFFININPYTINKTIKA